MKGSGEYFPLDKKTRDSDDPEYFWATWKRKSVKVDYVQYQV